MIAYWNTLPVGVSGYEVANLSSLANVSTPQLLNGTSNDNAFHFAYSFSASAAQAAAGPWQFRFGPDFGFGGVMLLDGNVLQANWTDMWWDFVWTNPTQILENTTGVTVTAGPHLFEVYGFDDCCAGPMEGDVNIGGGGWQPISNQILTTQNAAQYITFNPVPNQAIGSGSVALSATASSGLAVTWTSVTPAVCNVSGNSTGFLNNGICSIKASQAGNASWLAAAPVTQSFSVGNESQTISFGALQNQSLGDAPFQVTATSSSGLPLSFSSNSPATCSVSGDMVNGYKVSLLAVGDCMVTATQAGNLIYGAANNTQSFYVLPAPGGPLSQGLVETRPWQPPYSNGSVTSNTAQDIALWNQLPTGISGYGIGTFTSMADMVTSQMFGGSATNNAFHFVFEFNASAAQAAAGPWQFRFGPDFGFGGVMLLDGNILQSMWNRDMWWDFVWTDPTQILENTTGVTVQAGPHVFEVYGFDDCCAGGMEADVNIGRSGWQVISSQLLAPVLASQTIRFGIIFDQLANAAPFSLSATATSALPITYTATTLSVCTVAGNTVTIKGVGTCSIHANQAGNANYNPAPEVIQSFNVSLVPQTVTFGPLADVTFGTGPMILTAQASSGLLVTFTTPTPSVCTVTGQTVAIRTAGVCAIIAYQPGNPIYAPSDFVIRPLNILKATPIIAWSQPASITFGTPLSATQLDVLTAGFPGTIVYTPPAGTVLPAGNGQTLSAVFTPTDTLDYSNVTKTATINVGKATPSITWTAPAAITFGSALGAGQLNATVSAPGVLVYTPAGGTVLPVGNGQSLSVGFTPNDTSDYNSTSASTTINVNPAALSGSPVNLVVTRVLTRSGGNVVVQLTISNTGGTAAQNVTLTGVTVGADTGTPLPQIIGTIGAGGSAQATISIPGSVGTSGTASSLSLSGTYIGGTFGSSARIALP